MQAINVQTIDVRVLLPDGTDPEYFVQQLVQNSSGPGAPLAAVTIETGCEPNGEYTEEFGRVFAGSTAAAVWHGEIIYPQGSET